MNSIPFFYYDLTARIAPGMLAIALLRLTTFGFPPPWRAWPALHYALGQPVLLPLIYGGVAYLIGMVLDVMLGQMLRQHVLRAWSVEGGHSDLSSDRPISTSSAGSVLI
ncbi:MAG TPA: hypothetical protein VF921_00235 [Vicinamibacterales bacterium]